MKLLSTIVMVAPVLALSSSGVPARDPELEPPAVLALEASPLEQLAEVGIRGMAFTPASVTIGVGSTVVWKNNDQVAHTATGTDGNWDSGSIPPGGSWRKRFDTPGTYSYFCGPHPGMRGTVVVKAK